MCQLYGHEQNCLIFPCPHLLICKMWARFVWGKERFCFFINFKNLICNISTEKYKIVSALRIFTNGTHSSDQETGKWQDWGKQQGAVGTLANRRACVLSTERRQTLGSCHWRPWRDRGGVWAPVWASAERFGVIIRGWETGRGQTKKGCQHKRGRHFSCS